MKDGAETIDQHQRFRWGASSVRVGSDILRNAIAEGPIFFLHLDEADEDVFFSELQRASQSVRNGFVECLLLRNRASLIEEDLDVDEVARAVNAEIIGIE